MVQSSNNCVNIWLAIAQDSTMDSNWTPLFPNLNFLNNSWDSVIFTLNNICISEYIELSIQ